jgi:hypothetical protein
MFSFIKVSPTTYVMQYKNGKVKREGAGIFFIYSVPTSTIVTIPLVSVDIPFAFHESTSDFQIISLQGQLTYRVVDPKKLAQLLDFSVVRGRYTSDDPGKLPERLVKAAQTLTRSVTQKLPLQDALISSESIAARVLEKLRASETVTTLGLEILGLSLLSVTATPEMARALEADAREALQRRSDEAIYARRNAAVEQERLIKESELNTEIAVETKKRQIRETQMAAEIAVEEQRAKLIDRRVENEKKDADSRAYTLTETLKPLRELDWKALMMLSAKGGDAKEMIAMAFQQIAENANKIGELNISPDLLKTLITSASK